MSNRLSQPAVIDDLLLYRLNRLLSVGGAPVIRLCEGRFGITRREWRVMAALAQYQVLMSSQLAEHAQLDRARTSRAISSLVAKGLINRQIVPSDQRKATVCLTDKGQALYASFFPVVADLNRRLVQSLGADELAMLDKALSTMQLEAEKMRTDEDLYKANRRRSGYRDA